MIEIMLVILIIGILYSVVSFNGSFAVDKAANTSVAVDMGVYEIALSDAVYNNEITSLDELSGCLNSTIEGQFKVEKVGDHLESINRTDRNGYKYEIHTTDYETYIIKCGDVNKVVEASI